jgi:hypothetical protein
MLRFILTWNGVSSSVLQLLYGRETWPRSSTPFLIPRDRTSDPSGQLCRDIIMSSTFPTKNIIDGQLVPCTAATGKLIALFLPATSVGGIDKDDCWWDYVENGNGASSAFSCIDCLYCYFRVSCTPYVQAAYMCFTNNKPRFAGIRNRTLFYNREYITFTFT